MKLIQLKNKTV